MVNCFNMSIESYSDPKYNMYRNRHALGNSVDPDQTPQNTLSDQGLHYLSSIQEF